MGCSFLNPKPTKDHPFTDDLQQLIIQSNLQCTILDTITEAFHR